jgi:hypothetical protein
MRTLSDKEANLIKLATYEGIDVVTGRLWTDFKVAPKKLTLLQNNRFSEFEDLLYTFLCEIVEDHGSLQSKYDR